MSNRTLLYKKDSRIKIKLSPFPFINRKIEEHMNFSFSLLDKPRGPTSHEVAAWIKKEFNVPVSHSGTLEYGEIPLCLGYYLYYSARLRN